MIHSDYHVHTAFSSDSETSPESQLEALIARGIKEVCITDHDDPGFPDGEFILDLDSYYHTITQLASRYTNRIQVHTGIEIGLWTAEADAIQKHAASYPWEFVIGSTHLVDGMDPYYEDYWNGRDIDQSVHRYYEVTLDNIRRFDCYDVYGHIDYIIRYIPKARLSEFHPELFTAQVDDILKELISRKKGIECNTAGFKYGLGQPNPCHDILRRYRQFGGSVVTIGSDGHKPEHVAYDFAKVPQLLADCGFDHYTVFRNRTPVNVPLLP